VIGGFQKGRTDGIHEDLWQSSPGLGGLADRSLNSYKPSKESRKDFMWGFFVLRVG